MKNKESVYITQCLNCKKNNAYITSVFSKLLCNECLEEIEKRKKRLESNDKK